jgi:glycerophosphoryl diester phosphodiesterase
LPERALHPDFLTRPLAHRALHDKKAGRPENSMAAIRAAIAAGYGIEIDVQPSGEGVPMVFHDYDLKRLTGETGAIGQTSTRDLAQMRLLGSGEAIPTLETVLDEVAGKVPLLIEVKDQDGALGPSVGPLERKIAALVNEYDGPVAVMSFNPLSVAAMADAAPDVVRGLTTCGFKRLNWKTVPAKRLAELAFIPDFERVEASFISHDKSNLASPHIARIKSEAPVLCWTIRSPKEEAAARHVADNVTFEGYLAPNTGVV